MDYSILFIDNHKIIRQALVNLLAKDKNVIAYEAAGESDGLKIIIKNKPDIVMLDVILSDTDGISLLNKIRTINPSCKVVFFTESEKKTDILAAYDNKADGYISKNVTIDIFNKCIFEVLSNKQYFDPDVLPLLNIKLLERDTHQELLNRLTKREKQMLICTANGLSNKEIASECKISERTVKNHLSRVFQKIEVSDRTQAAVFAIKTNLVEI